MPQAGTETLQVLAHDWIALQHAERDTPEYELLFTVFDPVWHLTHDAPELAWLFILEVLRQDDSDRIMENLSAGPLEDLLVYHGAAVIERVERQALADPKFAFLLGGVWRNTMSDEIWQRVVAVKDQRGWDGIPEGWQPTAVLSSLADYFRAEGFHVEFPASGGSVLVAAKPQEASGIRVYRRSAHVWLKDSDSWSALVGGIEIDERLSLNELKTYVRALMQSSDEEWEAEFSRRKALVTPSL